MNKAYKILFSFFLILMSGMGFSQSVPSYVPTNGLVGWWGFNGNAQDGSGNGNHGTVNGATLTTDRFGNQNGAYDFDGSNDFISLNQIFLGAPCQTVSFWTSDISFLNGGHIVTQSNFNSISGTNPTDVHWVFEYLPNTPNHLLKAGSFKAMYRSDCNNSTNEHWYNTLNVSNWNNITFALDSFGFAKIFVNSILAKSTQLNGLPTCALNFGTTLRFGGPWWNGDPMLFNGVIDDIGIWNRALTPQEITNLYNSQFPIQTSLCLPTITTSSPSSAGVDTVVIGGDISNDGGSSIVLRGVCYSTSPNPNMGNQRTEDGSGIGSFNTVLRGLTPSTTYYARSYAKNSNGVVAYGNEVTFTTTASLPGVRCPGTPTVTDIDGNIYKTVQIGNQCWTQSNLKVSKYMNGDNIPMGLSNSAWENTTSGAYAIYNNDPMNDGLFGKLYNHYAVTDSRGLCPTGWHVPSDGEWTILENYLGGSSVAGGALKSTATQPTPGGWASPNSGATNSSGFTALPGGLRDESGDFNGVSNGYWWSSTVSSGSRALYRDLSYTYNYFGRVDYYRSRGFSVRCLKNTLPQVNTTSVTNVTPSTALATGEVISDGGDQNTSRGFCYSITSNPTISNDTTLNGTGLGAYLGILTNLTPSSTYYVRAYSTNRVGTSYGNELSFLASLPPSPQSCPGTPTVTDIDGNVYNAVQIGTQCWTQSNLKVSKYRNGDNIPTGLNNSDWQSTTSGAYAIYNNDSVNDGLFGKLYNHYAVTDSRGLCPTGWHVPTDAEWTMLENHLGGSGVAGGALKSTAMRPIPGGWNPPNTGATNSSGFNGLPGGMRTGGDFCCMAETGFWWSSSLYHGFAPMYRKMDNGASTIFSSNFFFDAGFSVRCLKNTHPQVNTTSITNVTPSSALAIGEVISDGGDQNTIRGFCYSTTSNPTISNDTTMNGTGTGVYSGTLQNLNPSTTYYIRAYATNSMGTSYGNEVSFTTSVLAPSFVCGTSTVSDADNNSYNTVQIGTQCWTQSNLKVSKYRNGDNIPTGLSNSAWENTTSGAYAIYNNDPVNDGLYGKLYNHYAATDSRGLCPTGWHVPTDSEWNVLVKYLDPNADTTCANCMQSSIAGGSMKSTATQPTPAGWHNAANTGATNSSGFTGLPGGVRVWAGYFLNLGFSGNWWSSSVALSDVAWQRNLDYGNADAYRYYNRLRDGFSVRCARD